MNLSALHPFVRYVRLMRLTQDSRYDPYLPYDARLFYTRHGHSIIRADGNEYRMSPGSILYINAGVTYHLQSGEADYIAVNFDLTHRHSRRTLPIPPAPAEREGFAPLEQLQFTDAPELNRCYHLPSCPGAEESLTALLDEYERRLPHSTAYSSALITGLLVRMLRYTPDPEDRLRPEQVVDYIRRHYREDLTGERLSEVFRYHKNHISAVIRRHTGRPLHRFVLETRIRHALPLLEEGRLSVAQVAREVGFADANYFTRYFKQIIGVTPLTYRNQGGTTYEDRLF